MAILQGNAKSVAQDGGFYPTEIAQSLRFNDNDSAYLSRTPSVAGNRKTWTWSGWVKRAFYGNDTTLFSAASGIYTTNIRFTDDDRLHFFSNDNTLWLPSVNRYRDSSSWYHIVAVLDTTQAVSTDRAKLWVNGEQVTDFEFDAVAVTYPPQNSDHYINVADAHGIGVAIRDVVKFFDGYLAEVHFCDGTAYTADAFGEFKSGVWVAKTPSVTYGTNGFYLDFADSGALGTDAAGSNNWTPTNLASTDVMLDSPTNNFATWNAIAMSPNGALQQGNLQFNNSTTSWQSHIPSSIGISSGKYYAEFLVQAEDTNQYNQIAVSQYSYYTGSTPYNDVIATYQSDGRVWTGAANTGHINYGAGDIVGVQINADDKEILFNVNGGSWFGATAGSGTPISYTENTVYFANFIYTAGQMTANFGQDSSFAGNKTPQSYTDDNGIGDFYYAPPTGYLALCTANLPEPSISPLNDASPSDYFNTVTYTGNGTSQSISGVGFQPDFVWGKQRTGSNDHWLHDTVRGIQKQLESNTTIAEVDQLGSYVNTVEADGFTVGNSIAVNAAANGYVAWNWKAGGTPVTNTDGTITSSVSANTESGFSIVSYNVPSAVNTNTAGHGLTQEPEIVITKSRVNAYNWWVITKLIDGSQDYLKLNGTDAATNDTFATDITSTTIPAANAYVGVGEAIAYCFHSVEGFSKFGKYTGNGSADGPFVYCGFKPAFVMIKRTDTTGDWRVYDAVRDPDNITTQLLRFNLSDAEATASPGTYDFLSNGFKLRTTATDHNASGGTYIYMAFAENPFKYSNAR